MHLWRAYEGPERFDCLSIGKVARWGQIRPQNALSLPQSPFDYKVALHRSRTLAISVSSLRFYFTECHILAMEWRTARRPVRWRAGYGCSRAGLWRQYSVPPGIAEVANVLVTEKVDEARHG